MKIVILNGSPKGEHSVSLQFLNFIKKHYSNVEFEIFHIGKFIAKLENNPIELEKICDIIKESQAVIWVSPVYHFTIPFQVKKFVELINDRDLKNVFHQKYSTSILSSIHFYDTLAENYIQGISEDWNMNYFKGHLPHMEDLNQKSNQKLLIDFFEKFKYSIENRLYIPKHSVKQSIESPIYNPLNVEDRNKSDKYKILLLTDNFSKNGNINKMIDIFVKSSPNNIEIVNLDELETKGGCLGCCKCAFDEKCVYNDELDNFFINKYLNADAYVMAFPIIDRYFSSSVKRFWDRSFKFGHKSRVIGKNIVYLIEGDYLNALNVKQDIETRTSIMETPLIDVIHDTVDSETLTKHLCQTSNLLIHSLDKNYKSSENFHSVAGHKIFRDFLYHYSFLFYSDHLFYKKNKKYDFPQKRIGLKIFTVIMRQILKITPIRKGFYKQAAERMADASKKIVKVN